MKPNSEVSAAAEFDQLLARLRPKLHRYCARMVGSVIDGEDVLQDALIKAVEAFASAGPIGNPEGWLFKIAHNTALDFLRRRVRQEALRSAEEVDMIADQLDVVTSRQIAGASLRTFMRLPVAQRSSVILMDVLGCSLQEVCAVMDYSLPAVKAALHRGRAQLRELAEEPDDLPQPKMSEETGTEPRQASPPPPPPPPRRGGAASQLLIEAAGSEVDHVGRREAEVDDVDPLLHQAAGELVDELDARTAACRGR